MEFLFAKERDINEAFEKDCNFLEQEFMRRKERCILALERVNLAGNLSTALKGIGEIFSSRNLLFLLNRLPIWLKN
jgi:hypothetical protein